MPAVRRGSREEQPLIQGVVAAWVQEGLEELSTFKVRRGSGEEIPLIQGKAQQLHFAGAAVKRYPMSKVRETQGGRRRWRRKRMGRPLSPSQIHQKNISTLSKLHKTTSECWQRTSGTQKSRSLSSKTGRKNIKDGKKRQKR